MNKTEITKSLKIFTQAFLAKIYITKTVLGLKAKLFKNKQYFYISPAVCGRLLQNPNCFQKQFEKNLASEVRHRPWVI